MNLPVYALEISTDLNDQSEVDFVALVDNPAIQRNFLAFNDHKEFKFEIQSEEKQIISGPLMLADTPIYRNDKSGEYYVTFSPKTIEQIVQKFFQKGFQNNVNLMHDANQQVQGVTMFESFICDPSRGIMPMKGFEDAPAGSWFGSFKIDNPQVWSDVKAGKFSGFSVEGLFNYRKQIDSNQKMWEQICDILDQVKG